MTPTITAFERSPDRGKGLARDMRVRWALEEVSQPYDVRLLSFNEMKETAHRALHPFGQIPTYEEGDLALRLGELSSRLGDADWLDDAFSAGDLLMVTVLRRLDGSGILEKYPNLSAYIARGEARPAYKRAFHDQLAVFTDKSPTS